MYRKFLISLLSLILLSTSILPVKAAVHDKSLVELQELSERLYKSAKIKDYEKAKMTIEEISVLIPSITYEGLTTVEGMEAISSTIIHTKRSLAALEPQYKSVLFYTTQLHLVIDALGHPEQPLWHRYYSLINKDFEKIKSSIKYGENEMKEALQSFQLHYMLIKPALLVSKPAFAIEKIDSLITALISQSISQNKEVILDELQKSIIELFYEGNQETLGGVLKETTIWKTSLGMGFIIFLVLSYVIWRKFKGSYLTSSS